MKLTAETTMRTDRGDYLAEWMRLTYTPISVVCFDPRLALAAVVLLPSH